MLQLVDVEDVLLTSYTVNKSSYLIKCSCVLFVKF